YIIDGCFVEGIIFGSLWNLLFKMFMV
ncbi:MAG: hypothetical protein RIR17_630, partial [Planctomycetota bacterium]